MRFQSSIATVSPINAYTQSLDNTLQRQQLQQQQQQQPPAYSQSIDNTFQRQQPPSAGLTLPQVIALIDSRLINLEKVVPNKDLIEESNVRYEILAEEISNLKEIVLSLQSYTMGVNKILMEERLNITNSNDDDDDYDDHGNDDGHGDGDDFPDRK